MNKILNVVKIIMLFIILFFIGFTHNFVLQKQNVTNKEVIITKGDKPNEIYKKLGLKSVSYTHLTLPTTERV